VRASVDTLCGGNRDETPVKHDNRRDAFPGWKNRRINIMESDGDLICVASQLSLSLDWLNAASLPQICPRPSPDGRSSTAAVSEHLEGQEINSALSH
jgi:hypothetical protein